EDGQDEEQQDRAQDHHLHRDRSPVVSGPVRADHPVILSVGTLADWATDGFRNGMRLCAWPVTVTVAVVADRDPVTAGLITTPLPASAMNEVAAEIPAPAEELSAAATRAPSVAALRATARAWNHRPPCTMPNSSRKTSGSRTTTSAELEPRSRGVACRTRATPRGRRPSRWVISSGHPACRWPRRSAGRR